MSLEKRAEDYMREFPGKKICSTTLRSIYVKHKIRRKRIRNTKVNNPQLKLKIKRQSKYMAEELQKFKDRGFRLVFLDETMVTKSTIPKVEWSRPNESFEIDYKQFAEKTIAVLAGISMERGVDLCMQFEKPVNIEKFLVWLEELRARWFFDDICLVMDNLSVHRSKLVLERIEELGFEHVFTPAYSPDLNPIELVFS